MTDLRRVPRPFVFFALACLAGASAMGATAWRSQSFAFDGSVALMVALVVFVESMAVNLPSGGSMSMSLPLTIATAVLYGPLAATLVVLAASVSVDDVRQRKHWAVLAYNAAQLVIATLVSSGLYYALGGRSLLANPLSAADFPRVLVPTGALVTTGLLVNVAMVSAALALLTGAPVRKVLTANVSWSAAPQVVLALLGVALGQVIALVGFPGLALFVFPLLVARQLHQRYVELRDAYVDTVRSLVDAIEAKDPYTRGHSERVAEHAIALGRALGMPDGQVERLEFAALLHDLGKVGIRSSILSKPASLTSDEYREIRGHPEIGARILERVPYLADVVPAVLAHHERFDGTGYCAGLVADEAPLEARILTVADSYDAMTAARPYRGALSHEAAMEELRLGAGSQFDPSLVARFAVIMEAGVLAERSATSRQASAAVPADA